jgi:hypothetical protein
MRRTEEDIVKKKAVMLNAIEVCFGNISKAAKMAKITTRTHYRWLKEDRQYAVESEDVKDICFRNRKEQLLEIAFELAQKGNITVVNKLLSIYCKNLPEEMRMASYQNNVPTRATIKWVSTPQDPRREGYVKPPEEGRGG